MVRKYTWRSKTRNYEADAWGFVSTAGVLRYLEETAILAADDAGFGTDFHEQQGTAWVVRRMTLRMLRPIRRGQEIELTTWIADSTKIRAHREYRIADAPSGETLYVGIAQWVYLDRRTLAPRQFPVDLGKEFGVTGGPVQVYDPPAVEPVGRTVAHTIDLDVDWHEIDSMGHVNNAMYADWLDDALKATMGAAGSNVSGLREKGPHLRGEFYHLEYKRAAMPGDRLRIATNLQGSSGRLLVADQAITSDDGSEVMVASSVHGWRDAAGEPASPPAE